MKNIFVNLFHTQNGTFKTLHCTTKFTHNDDYDHCMCDMCASSSFICVKTDVGMWSHDDKNDDDVLCI